MIYPSGDKLEESVESRYTLVVLAAKRAKQLREGAPKLIETSSTNPLTVALEEIAAGKVKAKLPSESELTAIELKRRQAWEAFEPGAAAAAEEAAPEEAAPSVQELLRVEGEETAPEEAATEEAALPSVAELLKVDDEAAEEPAGEEEDAPLASVADLLKIDDDEPVAEEAAGESEDAGESDDSGEADPEAAETGSSEE